MDEVAAKRFFELGLSLAEVASSAVCVDCRRIAEALGGFFVPFSEATTIDFGRVLSDVRTNLVEIERAATCADARRLASVLSVLIRTTLEQITSAASAVSS